MLWYIYIYIYMLLYIYALIYIYAIYIYIYFIVIIITILPCHQYRYNWPSLTTPPYCSSLLAGPQGYILYPHRAAVRTFELVPLLLLGYVRGSIGEHHLWLYILGCIKCSDNKMKFSPKFICLWVEINIYFQKWSYFEIALYDRVTLQYLYHSTSKFTSKSFL